MKRLLQQSSLGLALGIVTALALPFAAIAQSTAPQTGAATPVKAKPAAKSQTPSGGATAAVSHETVEYKDPEDMTTRYRPGNNKTSTAPTPGSPAGAATDAKKHIAGVKYEDRQATIPALDAASKDAAKSTTAPSTTPNNGKPAAGTDQDAKRANKIDSFTVKQ